MSILDTKSIKRTIIVYILISLFCIIFSYIYEQFSYGEYSNFMRYMFIAPLILGVVTYFIAYLVKINVARVSYNLWNSGVAIITSGMLIRGIINISGRYTQYDKIYWALGIIFILLAIVIKIYKRGS